MPDFTLPSRRNQLDAVVARMIEIEELRDEHGRVDDKPRYPNIASGQPWPIVR